MFLKTFYFEWVWNKKTPHLPSVKLLPLNKLLITKPTGEGYRFLLQAVYGMFTSFQIYTRHCTYKTHKNNVKPLNTLMQIIWSLNVEYTGEQSSVTFPHKNSNAVTQKMTRSFLGNDNWISAFGKKQRNLLMCLSNEVYVKFFIYNALIWIYFIYLKILKSLGSAPKN